MGYKLWRLIRDHAPQDWTSGELVVALMIADDANETTLRSFLTPAALAVRSRMTERGVRKCLERLLERGFEFRVVRDTDKNGNPVYGIRGKEVEYQVPDIFVRLGRASAVSYGLVDKLAVGGTAVPP